MQKWKQTWKVILRCDILFSYFKQSIYTYTICMQIIREKYKQSNIGRLMRRPNKPTDNDFQLTKMRICYSLACVSCIFHQGESDSLMTSLDKHVQYFLTTFRALHNY